MDNLLIVGIIIGIAGIIIGLLSLIGLIIASLFKAEKVKLVMVRILILSGVCMLASVALCSLPAIGGWRF